MANTYTEQSVIRDLCKISDINIESQNKVIYILKNSTNVGNKSWGKIDYLIKVHGYVQIFVAKIENKRKSYKEDKEKDIEIKSSKRDKLNINTMSNKVKNNMNRIKMK